MSKLTAREGRNPVGQPHPCWGRPQRLQCSLVSCPDSVIPISLGPLMAVPETQLEMLRFYVRVHNEARSRGIVGAQRSQLKHIVGELRELRETHRRSPLSPDTVAEVKTLKQSANLEQSLQEMHQHRFSSTGAEYLGTRRSTSQQHQKRTANCWDCHSELDSTIDMECARCGWILCWCGACGCRFPRS